jgi:biopolymer transport protein ExbB
MSQNKSGSGIQGMLAAIVIPAALILSWIIFKFILGSPGNFQDNNPDLNPLPGNYLGMMYKGITFVHHLIQR